MPILSKGQGKKEKGEREREREKGGETERRGERQREEGREKARESFHCQYLGKKRILLGKEWSCAFLARGYTSDKV